MKSANLEQFLPEHVNLFLQTGLDKKGMPIRALELQWYVYEVRSTGALTGVCLPRYNMCSETVSDLSASLEKNNLLHTLL
jgi:hypothetical protein